MNDLIRQGKILYWGVSEWSAEQIHAAFDVCRTRGWTPPASNQPEYNALQRSIEEAVLPVSEELGVGNVVWSPIAQGVLTGKYVSVDELPSGSRATGEAAGFMGRYMNQDVLDAVQALRPVAERSGCSLTQLALAWCLRQPRVSSVIVGATRVEHVDENVAAGDIDLDTAAIAEVDQLIGSTAVQSV
jgi:aryl-alcohol dehydrogenase-like predicted oxidoreductase